MRKGFVFALPCSLAITAMAVVAFASENADAQPSQAEIERMAQQGEQARSDLSRIHPDQNALDRAAKAKLLPSGVKSLLRVPTTLRHGEYVWNDDGIPAGKITVFVDIRRQMMSVFQGGHEIGTSVIVYGGPGSESPIGVFPIKSKYRDYHSRTYDAPMPHSMFLTNDGVAIHGNVMAAYRATKGCIGLPPEFAKLLFEKAKRGDRVEIRASDPDLLQT